MRALFLGFFFADKEDPFRLFLDLDRDLLELIFVRTLFSQSLTRFVPNNTVADSLP